MATATTGSTVDHAMSLVHVSPPCGLQGYWKNRLEGIVHTAVYPSAPPAGTTGSRLQPHLVSLRADANDRFL